MKKDSKQNTKLNHQITKKENKRRRAKTPKKKKKSNTVNIHTNNYLKCKWIKCSNQNTRQEYWSGVLLPSPKICTWTLSNISPEPPWVLTVQNVPHWLFIPLHLNLSMFL